MGAHSKGVSFRARTAVALVVSGLAALGMVGTATAGDGIIDGTPCSVSTRACVDIASKQAWLIDDGAIVRGPVPVSTGGEGRETPRGSFTVDWKNKDHKSTEFNGAPMPFAVFFAPGGVAFHEGNLHTQSAGCVRMAYEDAEAWFAFLQPGDAVEVH